VSQDNLLFLLRKKLNDFQKEKIITADPGLQFELKQRIKEIQQQIKELEKSYKKKYNFPLDKELEIALWSLNHSQQFAYFQLLAQNFHHIVGIRIQISPSSHIPLTWLLRCLVKNLVKNEDDIIYVRLHLDTHRYRINNNFQLLLEGISESLKLPGCNRETPVEEIIEKICEKMKEEEQHIILLLYGIDYQKKVALDRILNDFWRPLIQKIKKSSIQYHLLMFWIDYKQKIDWRDIYIFQDKPESANEEMPFNIYVTNKFKQEDLKMWIKGQDGQSILTKVNYESDNSEDLEGKSERKTRVFA
jgi:inactive STAND